MLGDREFATVILFALVVAWAAVSPKSRGGILRSVGGVVRALVAPRILAFLLCYFAYVTSVVWAAWRIGWWRPTMTVDTVLLVFGAGMALYWSASKIRDGRDFVATVVRDSVGLGALALFYVNLVAFPLWAEVILQALAGLLAGVQMLARRDPNAAAVAKLCTFGLTAIGMAFLWRTTANMASSWRGEDWATIGLKLAMSVWLPVALVLLVYVLAYVLRLGVIRSQMRALDFSHQRPPRRLGAALAIGCRGSLRLVSDLPWEVRTALARVATFREALAEVSAYRRAQRAVSPRCSGLPTS